MFSPQSVDAVDREKRVFTVRPGQPLPWDPDHELAMQTLPPKQAWRHVIYLGIYRLDEVYDVLSRVYEPDEDSYDERPSGESAIAAFTVGEDGCAIRGSEVLSSCAWATSQVLRGQMGGADSVARFQDACLHFSEAWRDLVTHEFTPPQDGGAPRQELPQPVPRVLDVDDLDACLATAVTAADVGAALSCVEIRIRSEIVARRTANDPGGHDFLNSLIMGDLTLVAEQAATGNIGAALRKYLCPEAEIPTGERIDVRDRIDRVLAATAPDTVPAGRWPGQPEHGLALNQQLAVSTAQHLADADIMAVNGPPGTGKTTMLRDLIAALVVERARRLAARSDPKKAFTGQQKRWRTGQYNRVVNVMQPDLTGFEVVVASSNNGAVQNVTDEIPAEKAIDAIWREQAAAVDYFPEIATALLAPESDDRSSKTRKKSALTDAGVAQASNGSAHPNGWALLAARLGKKANRSRFVDLFWYHKPDESHDDAWSGLLAVLKEYEQAVPDEPWSDAVADFRTAEARVEALRTERSAVYQAIERRPQLDHQLADLTGAVSAAVEKVDAARRRRDFTVRVEREQAAEADRIARARHAEAERIARRRRDDAERNVHEREAVVGRIRGGRLAHAERTVRSREAALNWRWSAHAAHQQSRPGFWESLRTFGAVSGSWSRQDMWLETEVRTARHELDAALDALNATQQELDVALRAVDNARRALEDATRILATGVPVPHVPHEPLVAAHRDVVRADEELTAALHTQAEAETARTAAEARLADLDNQLAQSRNSLGKHYPDNTWRQDREHRELVALWTDSEWNTARSELFLAALALHKAFLRHAATEMRQNLQAAMDLVSGDAPRDITEEKALAAWRSLFFVVPVVSTTFSSYVRLFGHLGREALGWLLIDEAGQATPQNAVGALWRTRRAVVVGDPLQLEPITTLPFRAEQAIRNEHGVDEQWSPSRTSVQRLADRVTAMGTTIPDDDGGTWVGIPLTVHRRCDQPMFDIVNTIAYDGLMINGTGLTARERFGTRYPTLPDSKWIDVASGVARGHWIPDEGRQLDRILDVLARIEFDMSQVMVIGPFRDIAREIARRTRNKRYQGLIGGTIHTAQGKQADVVIVVLGSNPGRPGARRWAAGKPNLLNVAVSRAKRRLYVIGNRDAWSTQRHFNTLATNLPYATPSNPGPDPSPERAYDLER